MRSPAELVVLPARCTPSAGLRAISQAPQLTQASSDIQATIQLKIDTAQREALASNRHTVRAVMPLAAAYTLQRLPELIGPAVEAFYLRDRADLRAAQKMECFMPAQFELLSTLVPATVRFTR